MTPDETTAQALAAALAKHKPVLNKLLTVSGCQCMDRVFAAGQENYEDHLAAVVLASGVVVPAAEARRLDIEAMAAQTRWREAVERAERAEAVAKNYWATIKAMPQAASELRQAVEAVLAEAFYIPSQYEDDALIYADRLRDVLAATGVDQDSGRQPLNFPDESSTPERAEGAGEGGLEARYRVEKINDPTGKHTGCRYFVLDPQHDPIAREALKLYAKQALRAGYVPLFRDLWRWVRGLERATGSGESDGCAAWSAPPGAVRAMGARKYPPPLIRIRCSTPECRIEVYVGVQLFPLLNCPGCHRVGAAIDATGSES